MKETQTHGRSGGTTYRAWHGIKQLTCNKNSVSYHLYGGRGIKLDKRWLKFEGFLEDMETAPRDGIYSIARHDADGDFTKANCYWKKKEKKV